MRTEMIVALPGEMTLHPVGTRGCDRRVRATPLASVAGQARRTPSETNGVDGEHGAGPAGASNVSPPTTLTFRRNADFGVPYMPFDSLLFFADAGSGDQFALGPHTDRADVFTWNHENDIRIWVAPGLSQYTEWWLTDRIKLRPVPAATPPGDARGLMKEGPTCG